MFHVIMAGGVGGPVTSQLSTKKNKDIVFDQSSFFFVLFFTLSFRFPIIFGLSSNIPNYKPIIKKNTCFGYLLLVTECKHKNI